MAAAAQFTSRKLMIAKLHIARKELGLDEDAYRAALEGATGKTSAGDMTEAELGRALDGFKARGWKPRTGATTKTRPAEHPAAKKARALWISLHQLGVVRDPSEKALETFAARQLKVEHLAWADQGLVYKLIEALKAMGVRAGWDQSLDGVKAEHVVITLKRRLVRAQCKILGLEPPVLIGMLESQMDELARRYGHEIRAAKD